MDANRAQSEETAAQTLGRNDAIDVVELVADLCELNRFTVRRKTGLIRKGVDFRKVLVADHAAINLALSDDGLGADLGTGDDEVGLPD